MRDIIYMIILIHLQTPLIQKFIGKNIFLMWMIISKMMERFQKK